MRTGKMVLEVLLSYEEKPALAAPPIPLNLPQKLIIK
jgi:hypothetical protein